MMQAQQDSDFTIERRSVMLLRDQEALERNPMYIIHAFNAYPISAYLGNPK